MTSPNLIVMGVSGAGKTSLGQALAAALGADFTDADDLHPPENRARMAAGQPLTDADRWPWLDLVAQALAAPGARVVACSALKRVYRDRLRAGAGPVVLVWPHGPAAVIAARMAARKGHFMPPALLESQLATLEPPDPDEAAIRVDLTLPLPQMVTAVLAALSAAR